MQANCIVEPRCREQFQLAHATPTYEHILSEVPEVFVGSPRRLQSLVEALAPCMAQAFAAHSTPLPPWRKKLSMLTKWNLKGSGGRPSAAAQQQQRQRMPAYARDLQQLQVSSQHVMSAQGHLAVVGQGLDYSAQN